MKHDDKTDTLTTTIQEVAYYNMFLTEAILELLAERGILTGEGTRARQETEERNSCSVSLDAVTCRGLKVPHLITCSAPSGLRNCPTLDSKTGTCVQGETRISVLLVWLRQNDISGQPEGHSDFPGRRSDKIRS
jgi:hypothetical protein